MHNDKHRRLVANYFSGKVKELRYHLEKIVEACNESLRLFHAGTQTPTGNSSIVIYCFSSFANVALTLKDSASTILNVGVSWSNVKKLTHGDFVFSCRNAMTHDGHPIISMWADGYYYVPADIMRLDDKGKLVKINTPNIDIRTLCLEFTLDYCDYLDSILHPALNDPILLGVPLEIDQILDAINNPQVPNVAKEILDANIHEIYDYFQICQQDPIKAAIQQVSELKEYCKVASLGEVVE